MMALRKRTLYDVDGLRVQDVGCAGTSRGWSEPEVCSGWGLVLVRSGGFLRSVAGRESFADPAMAYFELPGTEQRVAHPVGHGDVCTAISIPDWAVGEAALPATPEMAIYTDDDLDFKHRLLLATIRRSGDAFGVSEAIIWLIAQAVSAYALDKRTSGVTTATSRSRRRSVDHARQLLSEDPVSLTLFDLAREVALSPYHLCRVFREVTGETLTRYRRRLRVRLAISRLEHGERNLARLAAELGFADQAHMTRSMQRLIGRAPAGVRSLLG